MNIDPPPGTITEFVYEWRNWLNNLYEWVISTVKYSFESASSAITINSTVTLIDTSGGAVTATLPPAGNHEGRVFIIKDIDAGAPQVTVDGDGSETIDGALTLVLNASRGFAVLISDGSNWHIIGQ